MSKEEVLAVQEKAVRGHQEILVTVHRFLAEEQWEAIEEIPAAIDMRANRPGVGRVIFEAKTLKGTNEIDQCRAGLSQLFESRFFYGEAEELCMVVDAPIADARLRFLESTGLAVV
jgi:hypothetical protein